MSAVDDKMAAVSDEDLFKKPPPNEDCPICMLPLPSLDTGSKYNPCCGNFICSGCIYAVAIRDTDEQKCPFCRTPNAPSEEEIVNRLTKRADVDDAEAMFNLGCNYNHGSYGLTQDRAKALKLWHRAAELGHVEAYYNIGGAYYHGNGVERDTTKAKHYWELGAIRGCTHARHNLGIFEGSSGNLDKALKHLMIAVGSGKSHSLDTIRKMFMNGNAAKEDYTNALRVYQAYVGEIKSVQRDEAAAASDLFKYY